MPLPDYLKPFPVTFADYKAARARPGIPNARSALHNAKYGRYRADLLARWAESGGRIVPEYEARDDWKEGDARVRIIEIADDDCDLEDLKGDAYCPKGNPDINPNRLKREEREFEERVARHGVWGYRAEYWDGYNWTETDSIWGFIGNDFIESCDDDDLMSSALQALADHDNHTAEAVAAEIAESRPDLAPTYV
jgi:hypothetical protein